MDNHLFSVIEYQKIKKELKKEIYTYPGKYFLEEMNPLTDMQDVILSQKTTSEMKNIFELESELPFTRLLDIERYLKESKIKGGILKARQLLDIARVLECLFLIKNFFTKVSPEKYSLIRKYISNIKVFRSLEKEIKTCINDDGEIVDNASSTLKRIRQQTRNAESRIRDKLENMIRDPINRTLIQDEIITIRQGRFVLPIKQQEKSKFPGIVQDKSESGVTVFIEPLPIVELNNELRELSHEEKKELYKILQNLTILVGKNYEDIMSSYKILGQLDLINAKARLSIKMHGIEP
ncbi:MAG: hypothetical protein PHD33_04205, partial [Atribacterota bacterium]|nr:hypothetical protein [Atribacterota bacterium]